MKLYVSHQIAKFCQVAALMLLRVA